MTGIFREEALRRLRDPESEDGARPADPAGVHAVLWACVVLLLCAGAAAAAWVEVPVLERVPGGTAVVEVGERSLAEHVR